MVICDFGTTQYDDGIVNCEGKKKVQLNVAKIQSYVMLVLPNMTLELSNVRKKEKRKRKRKRELLNVTKVRLYVMLVLCNVTMKLSNVQKKIKVPPNVRKIRLYVIFVLPDVTMEPSNVRKKNKGTTECDKSTVICDVGTA